MSYRAVILCVVGDEHSGWSATAKAIAELLPDLDAVSVHREALALDAERVAQAAQSWLGRCQLLLISGGVGAAQTDIVPAVAATLVERPLPGFGEYVRMRRAAEDPATIGCRVGAGVARETLLLWLPAEAREVRHCLGWLAPGIRATLAALQNADS